MNEATDVETKKYFDAWRKYEETNGIGIPQTRSTDLLMAEVNYWSGQGYSISQVGSCGNGLPSDVCTTFTNKAQASIYPLYDYVYYSLIVNKYKEETTTKGPFLQTLWEQGSPFNNSVPLFANGTRPDLGCATIAAGQIMAFHEWPSGSAYNWTTMKASNGGSSTVTQNFLYNLGVDIKINYSVSPAASLSDILAAFKSNKYGYSSTASSVEHNSVTVRSQLNIIQPKPQPVLMYGNIALQGQGGDGHFWVCDGLRSIKSWTEFLLRVPTSESAYTTIDSYEQDVIFSYYFHMNWGWGLGFNGWYADNDVLVDGDNFQHQRINIINIKKP